MSGTPGRRDVFFHINRLSRLFNEYSQEELELLSWLALCEFPPTKKEIPMDQRKLTPILGRLKTAGVISSKWRRVSLTKTGQNVLSEIYAKAKERYDNPNS